MAPVQLAGTAGPLIENHDSLLLDLDGVVYLGPKAIPHAVETISALQAGGLPVAYVTNNSSRAPQTVAEHLQGYGLDVAADHVATSAQAAVAIMQKELAPGSRVLVVGGPGLRAEVVGIGMEIVESKDDNPAAVVQGFSPHVGWQDLAEAAYAIGAGARFYATNTDLSIPTERGTAPGNGSLVLGITNATGVVPTSAGKPEPQLFWHAASLFNSQTPLMVGDRLDTDLAGAVAANMPGLLVFTGVTDAAGVISCLPHERPTFLSLDLRGLLQAHPAPHQQDNLWVCGDARAQVGAGEIQLSQVAPPTRGSEAWLDAVRALCAAVWHEIDRGESVDFTTIPRL